MTPEKVAVLWACWDYPGQLTPAEISRLVSEGLSNKEIAQAMFLSEGTVRNYITIILEKLQLRDRTQLAIAFLGSKK